MANLVFLVAKNELITKLEVKYLFDLIKTTFSYFRVYEFRPPPFVVRFDQCCRQNWSQTINKLCKQSKVKKCCQGGHMRCFGLRISKLYVPVVKRIKTSYLARDSQCQRIQSNFFSLKFKTKAGGSLYDFLIHLNTQSKFGVRISCQSSEMKKVWIGKICDLVLFDSKKFEVWQKNFKNRRRRRRKKEKFDCVDDKSTIQPSLKTNGDSCVWQVLLDEFFWFEK